MRDYDEIFQALAMPFEEWETKRKPQKNGGFQLYVDRSTIENRLDEIMGPANWEPRYRDLGGCFLCRLTLTLPDGRKVSKSAVGAFMNTDKATPALQDEANLYAYRMKAAQTDSLKRAAESFGIARYLGKSGVPACYRAAFEAALAAQERIGQHQPEQEQAPARQEQERRSNWGTADRGQAQAPPPPRQAQRPPRTGQALQAWIRDQEQRYDCEILKPTYLWGREQGFSARMSDWSIEQTEAAYHEVMMNLNGVGTEAGVAG